MNFKIALMTFLVGALSLTGTPQTTESQDPQSTYKKFPQTWVDPDGYLIQCFACDADTNMPPEISDCFYTEPIFKEIMKNDETGSRYQYKVLQMYPIAYSIQNGLKYQGVLNLGIRYTSRDEWVVRLNVLWIREDGLTVHFVQRIRFRYLAAPPGASQNSSQEPASAIEILRERTLTRCLAGAMTDGSETN